MALFPPIFASKGWYTSIFIARRLNKSPRTIQHWCKTGFFSRRGCIVLSTPPGSIYDQKGVRYWVYIPPSMSKDAILSKVPIDTSPTINLPSLGTVPRTQLCKA